MRKDNRKAVDTQSIDKCVETQCSKMGGNQSKENSAWKKVKLV